MILNKNWSWQFFVTFFGVVIGDPLNGCWWPPTNWGMKFGHGRTGSSPGVEMALALRMKKLLSHTIHGTSLVYLPTWMVDFDGKSCRDSYTYQSHGCLPWVIEMVKLRLGNPIGFFGISQVGDLEIRFYLGCLNEQDSNRLFNLIKNSDILPSTPRFSSIYFVFSRFVNHQLTADKGTAELRQNGNGLKCLDL